MNKKKIFLFFISIIILSIILNFTFGQFNTLKKVACTDDMKQCPDGSYVTRNPLNNCNFYPCPGEETNINQCIDSDGLNFTKKSTTINNLERKTDSCLLDINNKESFYIYGKYLAEYYCNNNKINVTYIDCRYGCIDGACYTKEPNCTTIGTVMYVDPYGYGYIGCDIIAEGPIDPDKSICISSKTRKNISLLIQEKVKENIYHYYNTLTGLDPNEEVRVYIRTFYNGTKECYPPLNKKESLYSIQTNTTNQETNTTNLNCSKEGEMCGGFAGYLCCDGLKCKYENGFITYPDESGVCVPIQEKIQCQDTDYYNLSIPGNSTKGNIIKKDTCYYDDNLKEFSASRSGKYLAEYYCDNNNINVSYEECFMGCYKSACYDKLPKCKTLPTTIDNQGTIVCNILVEGPIDQFNSYCIGESTRKNKSFAYQREINQTTDLYSTTLTNLNPTEKVRAFIKSYYYNSTFECYPQLNSLSQNNVNNLLEESLSYKSAYWICQDGTEVNQESQTSCNTYAGWFTIANEFCKDKCSLINNSCGILNFIIGEQCNNIEHESPLISYTLETNKKVYEYGETVKIIGTVIGTNNSEVKTWIQTPDKKIRLLNVNKECERCTLINCINKCYYTSEYKIGDETSFRSNEEIEPPTPIRQDTSTSTNMMTGYVVLPNQVYNVFSRAITIINNTEYVNNATTSFGVSINETNIELKVNANELPFVAVLLKNKEKLPVEIQVKDIKIYKYINNEKVELKDLCNSNIKNRDVNIGSNELIEISSWNKKLKNQENNECNYNANSGIYEAEVEYSIKNTDTSIFKSKTFLVLDPQANSCNPVCKAISTNNEGWYNSCTGVLLKYEKCSITSKEYNQPKENGEYCLANKECISNSCSTNKCTKKESILYIIKRWLNGCTPSDEICDGKDNNCNNLVDEGCIYCSDTDKGFNVYTKGIVNGRDNINIYTKTDNCRDNYNLTEFYCYKDIVYNKTYRCPYGCNDGRCLETSNPKTVNVMVINIEPKINGINLTRYMKWNSIDYLIDGYIKDIYNASNGYIKYKVVNYTYSDEFPIKKDGFRYNENTYLQCLNNHELCHMPDEVDYEILLSKFKVCDLVNKGLITEVWIFNGPFFGFYEANMAGPGWETNGPVIENTDCLKPVHIMGF
ncbi:MAG: hypothetical protein QW757_04405, partial [Candidatus Woesearchaeota archaeon]